MTTTLSNKTLDFVKLSLLTAIIFLLAFVPGLGYIPIGPTRATTIHIPVIIGSILLGPKKGAILGFFFGLTSLIINTVTPTITSFVFSPFFSSSFGDGNFFSLVICFVPRILIGIVPYYAHKALKFIKNNSISLAISAVLGSLVNTLLVMNLIFFCFKDSYASAKGIAIDTLYNVILSVIVINGIPEAIVAGIIVAAVCKILKK